MNSEIEQDFYEESSQPFWWKILPKYLKKLYLDVDIFIHNYKCLILNIFAKPSSTSREPLN